MNQIRSLLLIVALVAALAADSAASSVLAQDGAPDPPAAALAAPAAPSDSTPNRPVVTVLDFETGRTGWVPPPHLGATLADLLADRLVSSGEDPVFDRQWLGDPTITGRIVPLATLRDQAVHAGVDFVVVGSVMRFSNESRQRSIGAAGFVPLGAGSRKQKTDAVIGLTIRVVDARTGELVASATAQGAASRTKRSIGLLSLLAHRVGMGGLSSSATGSHEAMLDEALHQAVEQAGAALTRAAPQIRRQSNAGANERSPVSYTPSSAHAARHPDHRP